MPLAPVSSSHKVSASGNRVAPITQRQQHPTSVTHWISVDLVKICIQVVTNTKPPVNGRKEAPEVGRVCYNPPTSRFSRDLDLRMRTSRLSWKLPCVSSLSASEHRLPSAVQWTDTSRRPMQLAKCQRFICSAIIDIEVFLDDHGIPSPSRQHTGTTTSCGQAKTIT